MGILDRPADVSATGLETRGSFGMRVELPGDPPRKRGEYGWSQQSVKLPLLKLTLLVRIQPLAPFFTCTNSYTKRNMYAGVQVVV